MLGISTGLCHSGELVLEISENSAREQPALLGGHSGSLGFNTGDLEKGVADWGP